MAFLIRDLDTNSQGWREAGSLPMPGETRTHSTNKRTLPAHGSVLIMQKPPHYLPDMVSSLSVAVRVNLPP